MGVAFFDQENIMPNTTTTTTTHNNNSTASTSRLSCNCNVCNPPAETETTATQTSFVNEPLGESNLNLRKNNIFKEIIGNSKEVKIESNAYNLRIVGNNNRIRIKQNVGDLVIVGNSTRLKIKLNHGEIKYTGNDGRICLGADSSIQLVDYSGCNGILKVFNSKNFEQQKSSQNKNNTNGTDSDSHKAMGNTYVNKQFIGIKTKSTNSSNNNNNNISSNNKKSNCKSASYAGNSSSCSCSGSSSSTIRSSSCGDNFEFQFNIGNAFRRKNSMPDISPTAASSSDVPAAMRAPTIVQHLGNIVITNSSNVCITPFSY